MRLEAIRGADADRTTGGGGSDAAARRLQLVRLAIALRDKRDMLLGAEDFADPAWDILLDLYAAHLVGRPVSVGDACLGARVPQTTGLRWVEKLHRDGVVERRTDARDARRSLLRLAPDQVERLDRLFDWLSERLDGGGARSNRSSSRPSGA